MTLLRSLKRVWRIMKQKPWQLCRTRKCQTTPRAKPSKDLLLLPPNKRCSQPRWSQRLVVLLQLKAAKGKSRTTLARSKSKLVIWASMVARGAEATLEDVTNVGRRATKVKGYLGGSTGMPTVTECRGRLAWGLSELVWLKALWAYFWAAINPSSLTGVSSWEAWLVQLGCVSKCWARKASQKNCCSFQGE